MWKTRPRWPVPLVAVAAAAALAACSGGAGSDGSDGPGAAPVRIMTITVEENAAFSAPQVAVAAQAQVAALNAAGGIGGRPVELTVCDSKLDPNEEAACFRQAVEDEVDAVVGSLTFFGAGLETLDAAGVPYVGGQGLVVPELVSPVSFPADGGLPGLYLGMAATLHEAGVTRPVVVASDTDSSQTAAALLGEGFDRIGVDLQTVTVPLGQPDYSTQAQAVLDSGADGVGLAVSSLAVPQVVKALRQAGFTGVIATQASGLNDANIAALGEFADGLLAASTVHIADPADPAVAGYVERMRATQPDVRIDEIGLHTWNGFDLFAAVAGRLGSGFGRDALLAALNGVDEPVELPLAGSYRNAGASPPLPDYPRVFNLSSTAGRVAGTALTATPVPDDLLARLGGTR